MKIREEFLWGYAERLEEDAATALAYAMEELENSKITKESYINKIKKIEKVVN